MVGARQPSGDAIGGVLVGPAILLGEATAPQRRIDFGDGRAPDRNIPTVERPEVDP